MVCLELGPGAQLPGLQDDRGERDGPFASAVLRLPRELLLRWGRRADRQLMFRDQESPLVAHAQSFQRRAPAQSGIFRKNVRRILR